MEITDAMESDLPLILNLQKECYLEEANIYDDYAIPPLTQTLDSIHNDFAKQIFLKAIEGELIIGSVRAFQNEGTCFIGRLIVDKKFQNKGIGKALMKAIERRFGNSARFELFTGFKSLKNFTLYKKLGYTQFKLQKVHEKLELVFMEKFSA